MTPHATKYEPAERILWLAWGHFCLSDKPFTNKARLEAIERQIGSIVADTFGDYARGIVNETGAS